VISIPCPHCGPRNAGEFRHMGEGRPRPEPATTTPQQWRSYLYLRTNTQGWTTESWYHAAGCRRFFRLERNTDTDQIRWRETGTDQQRTDADTP